MLKAAIVYFPDLNLTSDFSKSNPHASETHLFERVLVAPVRVLEVGDQLAERAEGQGLVHQVLAPAHAQCAVAPVAVDAQNHVVEVVAGELGLKADGETLQGGQAVGQVAGGEAWGLRKKMGWGGVGGHVHVFFKGSMFQRNVLCLWLFL